jgi:NADPH-dependent 2,4-dienoyl-CoA reductase/sulfur reductase-like enzyme
MGTAVKGFGVDAAGHVRSVETSAGTLDADLVVLGLGVRPRATLAADAGLPVGDLGGFVVDEHQRVDADRHVWAAGDCVESRHRLTGAAVHVPLGTHANKQGWVVGRNVGATGALASFPGVLGTAVTKVCDLEIGITGLTERAASDAGLDAVSATIEATTRAGYYPGAEPMTVKMVADAATRRVLGAQIVGREGSALRIDTVATALWAGLSVDDVMLSDLAYAPPFSPTWDPVQVAARALAGQLGY